MPAGLKYAIAGASASSKLQSCPHQVEKMGISAGINGFEEYDAAIERASMRLTKQTDTNLQQRTYLRLCQEMTLFFDGSICWTPEKEILPLRHFPLSKLLR